MAMRHEYPQIIIIITNRRGYIEDIPICGGWQMAASVCNIKFYEIRLDIVQAGKVEVHLIQKNKQI